MCLNQISHSLPASLFVYVLDNVKTIEITKRGGMGAHFLLCVLYAHFFRFFALVGQYIQLANMTNTDFFFFAQYTNTTIYSLHSTRRCMRWIRQMTYIYFSNVRRICVTQSAYEWDTPIKIGEYFCFLLEVFVYSSHCFYPFPLKSAAYIAINTRIVIKNDDWLLFPFNLFWVAETSTLK